MNDANTNTQALQTGDITKVLEEIARKKLRLGTLAERKSDRLDFHEHAVWQIRDALEEAYKAGFAAASRR